MKIILTGASGFVGGGVLLECLAHAEVEQVLVVTRRPLGIDHPKLAELVLADLRDADAISHRLAGYDACFYCAGISSAGVSEADYTVVTYDTPLAFAQALLTVNPAMTLCHVSGASTDATEQGRTMWARVKGRAENALARLPFAHVYNFRPGLMKPTPGQPNVKLMFRVLAALSPVLGLFFPGKVCTMRAVGLAMINATLHGAHTNVLEVPDIVRVAGIP